MAMSQTTKAGETSESVARLARQVERCLRDLDVEALAEAYHPDAVLDSYPPQWRFQLKGRDEILAWYRRTLSQADDTRCRWTRTTVGGDLIVVEWELRFGPPEDEHLVREVNLFHTDGERIVEQAGYCTGVWDPDTIARQKAEAPMVKGWDA